MNLDYELGVYNADDDTLVYGKYISATRQPTLETDATNGHAAHEKNFAVYFPSTNSFVAAQLDIWIFSTLVLLLMMGFFAYAIYSLLQERKFSALQKRLHQQHDARVQDTGNQHTHGRRDPEKETAGIQWPGSVCGYYAEGKRALRRKIDQVLLGASSADYMRKPALEIVQVLPTAARMRGSLSTKSTGAPGSILVELDTQNTSILADRELLAQAINNLIDNAEKYSRQQPRDYGAHQRLCRRGSPSTL